MLSNYIYNFDDLPPGHYFICRSNCPEIRLSRSELLVLARKISSEYALPLNEELVAQVQQSINTPHSACNPPICTSFLLPRLLNLTEYSDRKMSIVTNVDAPLEAINMCDYMTVVSIPHEHDCVNYHFVQSGSRKVNTYSMPRDDRLIPSILVMNPYIDNVVDGLLISVEAGSTDDVFLSLNRVKLERSSVFIDRAMVAAVVGDTNGDAIYRILSEGK